MIEIIYVNHCASDNYISNMYEIQNDIGLVEIFKRNSLYHKCSISC
jgi:hypothetical protein